MDLDDRLSLSMLRFLTTLEAQRHLGRTAQSLNISAAKASRMLAHARRVFGDALYTRCAQGLVPTPRAQEISARAQAVLSAMHHLFDDAAFDPKRLQRVFRIACLDNAYPIMIEPALAALTRAAPQAGWALMPYGADTLEQLRTGHLDLAIFPAAHLPDDFAHLPLLKTPYVKVVRPQHPLERVLAQTGKVSQEHLRQFGRIQICVYPDTDDVHEGVPGPASIPLQTRETSIWTHSWLGAVRLMYTTDAVLTVPWRTAVALSHERAMVVLGRAQSVPWLQPAIVWHTRSQCDVALEWVRSVFVHTVRGGMGPLVGDTVQLGCLEKGRVRKLGQ